MEHLRSPVSSNSKSIPHELSINFICLSKHGCTYQLYLMWYSKPENTGVEMAFSKLRLTELNFKSESCVFKSAFI
jgi:hypothetical protein